MSPPDPFSNRPTVELLGSLLGKDSAEALAGWPLADLFGIRLSVTPKVPDAHTRIVCGSAKELLIRALREEMYERDCLDSPPKVRDFLRLRFSGLEHEVFAVLMLDSQNRLLADVELFRGTLSQASVYPREVVKLALAHNCAAVVFAHNHPSGSSEPSQADLYLTKSLRDALALVDVRTVDHFIVSCNATPTSLAERGLV